MGQLVYNLNLVLNGALFCFYVMQVLRYFRRRKESTLIKVVFINMLIFSLLTAKDIVMYSIPAIYQLPDYYLTRNVDRMLDLLAIPTFGMYAIELVYPGWPVRWYNALRMYLPNIILIPLSFFYTGDMLFIISMLAILLSGLAMTVFLFASLKTQKLYYLFVHRDYEMVTQSSVIHTLVAFFIFIIFFFFAYYINIEPLYVALKVFIFLCFIFVSLSIEMHMKGRSIIEENEVEKLDSKDVIIEDDEYGEEEPEEVTANLSDRIDSIVTEKELYLKADLTINDIAYELGTNRTYISNCLSKQKGMKFYDYVNSFRVRKAVEIMEKHAKESSKEKLLMEDLMYDCGFNSLNTFKRAFAKQMNCRPLEYFYSLKKAEAEEKKE